MTILNLVHFCSMSRPDYVITGRETGNIYPDLVEFSVCEEKCIVSLHRVVLPVSHVHKMQIIINPLKAKKHTHTHLHTYLHIHTHTSSPLGNDSHNFLLVWIMDRTSDVSCQEPRLKWAIWPFRSLVHQVDVPGAVFLQLFGKPKSFLLSKSS